MPFSFKNKHTERPKEVGKKIGGRLLDTIPKSHKGKRVSIRPGVSHQAVGSAGISFQKVSFGTSAFSVEVPEYMRRKR